MEDDVRWVKTHCARMDQGGCTLLAAVKDNRILKIKGDPNGFLNQGHVCPKGVFSADRLSHPQRLRAPLKRVGKRGEGKWQQISWSEALRVISDNFSRIRETYGAKSVAFCQGMPKGMEHFALIRLANIFGSPNVVAAHDVCHAPREITGVHTCGFYPVADFHYPSRLVMVWGSNATGTNEEGVIGSMLLSQVKNGTELIVVDPRETDLARRAKYWLRVRPGADNALAPAFLNVIIAEALYDREFVSEWTHGFDDLVSEIRDYTPERMSELTWVSADLIRDAARSYATMRPAALHWGNAVEGDIHNFDTIRALASIMAICGNLDVPGGNIQANEPTILGLGKFVRSDLIPGKREEMIGAYHRTIPRLMTVPATYFRRAVLEEVPYAVRGAYIQCANPMLAQADSRLTHRALMALDFLAVSEVFMTPTAALADIVLPAATHFEFNDIGHYGIGHGVILARPKVVDPPADCWPDIKILNELGKLLTAPELWYENWEDMLEEVLAPAGIDYQTFAEMGHLKGEDRFKKYQAAGFRTPSGKVELSLSQAEKLGLSPLPQFAGPPEDDPEYPLMLTSSKDPYFLLSSYRWIERLRKLSPGPVSEIHPDTADKYGVRDAEPVIIETRTGEITQTACVTDRVLSGVVNAAYGWWFPEGPTETQFDWEKSNLNVLTSTEKLGREFGTPNLRAMCCRIRPGS